MKKNLLSAACLAVFCACAEPWFDAGIANYPAWPTDGSALEVAGVGTWTGTDGADIAGTAGARVLDVHTTQDSPLAFTLAAKQDVATVGEVVVRTRVTITPSPVLPAVDPLDKGALTLVEQDGGAPAFYGLARDAVGSSNVWVRLVGPAIAETQEVELEIAVRKDADRNLICYRVDGTALTNMSGASDLEIVLPGSSEISTTGYRGTMVVSSLAGETPVTAPKVALTVPALEGLTLVGVFVNGVSVEAGVDGTYPVPAGATVKVTFTTEAGSFVRNPDMVFSAAAADFTLPAEGRPEVVAAREILSINEIGASNGQFVTKNGGQELDWIEIRNDADFDVDISGWYLYDDPSKDQAKWTTIQGPCVVPAHGFKVVWADKDYLGFADDEAFTRIGLSSSGEPVFLAAPGGEIVHRVDFGKQIKNISYGRGSLVKTLVGENAEAEYRVGGADSWTPVRGPVGMSAVESGFQVVAYRIDGTINNMDEAEAFLKNPSSWSAAPVTNVVQTLNFADNDANATDFDMRAFPGVNGDNFILVVTGSVNIPRAGLWTFSCGSDDGFAGTLSRRGLSWTWENRSARGHAQTYSTFSLPEAGVYALNLVYFEKSGGASLDVSVCEGDVEFSKETFKLLGSVESGVVHAGAFGNVIAADVESAMKGKTASCDWRASFNLAEALPETDALLLRIRYADGFTAKLNGTVFATAVAPAGGRSLVDALTYATFEIPASLARAGANVLEVAGVNNAVNDGDFLLAPEVVQQQHRGDFVYFENPTPGAANDVYGRADPTPEVQFSVPHGYKTEAFDLALSCLEQPDGAIYYTLDGTSPTVDSLRYTGPIHVSGTTVVRAAVPDADSILQCDTSATYLFVEDILTQNANPPAGFPLDGSVNGQKMVYGMNPTTVANFREQILSGFTNSISTVSIVVDPKHLFDPSSGIYVNATGNGRAWERATMVEQISPTNRANEFSIPAGLRIRGGYSRGAQYPKHSFRLFFRSVYGASKLTHPLFGDEGADEFQKIDFRTSQNYSWANDKSSKFTLIEDVFARDSQRALGQPYNRSRYYNLFINGTYWGVYQTEERVASDYASIYYGGSELDYDVVRTSQPGYTTDVVEGTVEAWETLWNMSVNQGYGSAYPDNYKKAMGLNPDGTRNLDYPILLNPTNVICYMLTAHFAGDRDSPASSSRANNIAAFRNRVDGSGTIDGFVFNRHDAEHSLYQGEQNTTLYGTEAGPNGSNFRSQANFNPAELNYRLLDNPEYKVLFMDLFYRHCLKEGGAMTAPVASQRWRDRMAELDLAVNCEAARWGGGSRTYADWIAACNNNLGFIANRTPVLLAQYRANGWYPNVDAAQAVAGNGRLLKDDDVVPLGEQAYLTGGAQGTVYYTLDGSDPRLEGGAVNPAAQTYAGTAPVEQAVPLFARGENWKYSDDGSQPADDADGKSWKDAGYADSAWASGAGVLGFKSGDASIKTALSRYENHASSGTQVTTFYFRRTFTAPAAAEASMKLVLTDYVDDGYVLYLNGTEIARVNMPAGAVDYATFTPATANPAEVTRTVTIPAGLLKAGENVLAAELHQCNATSSDATWDMGVSYVVVGSATGGLEIPPEGVTLTTRVRASDGTWGALDQVRLLGTAPRVVVPPNDAVRVAEVMSSTADGSGDGSEYLVLTNVTENVADLSGVKVTCAKTGKSPSLTLVLPNGLVLEPGTAMTFEKATYWPDAKITNGAVDMKLMDVSGTVFQTLHVDASWWGDACDGTGAAFRAVEFGDTVTEQAQWRPTFTQLPAIIRIAEVMSSTADGGGDGSEFIVLTNISDSVAADLAGLRITCAKAGGKAPSLDLTLDEGTIPAGGSLMLTKAANWPAAKITNGKVDIVVTDVAGETVQTLYVDASWWSKACDGTGAHFIAADFGPSVTTDAQWTPSFLPSADEAVKAEIAKAIVADDRIRTWLNGLRNKSAITTFAGDAATLRSCYVFGVDPETDPEIEVRIPSFTLTPGEPARIGGLLTIHGEESARDVNGTVYLYHAATLEALPTASDRVELGTAFPVAPRAVELPAGPSRFLQLRVE